MTVQMSVRPRRRHRAGKTRTDGEGGFALVLVLLVLVAVTVLAVGGVWVAQADSSTAVNHRMSSRAFQLADAVLSRFVGESSGIPATPRSYDFAEGSAEITSERLGVFAAGHEMYRLQATAELTADPNVTRTVTTRLMLDPLALDIPAGLGSGNNIRKDGTAGLVSGFDAAGEGDCPVAPRSPRPGVIAKDYDQSGGGGADTPDCDGPICGDPPIQESSDPLGTLDIDWQGILNGTVVEFDQVVSNVSNWPSVADDEWPVIFVDNDSQVSLSDAAGHSGQGILIINEDVKLEGDFQWNGVLLIGGALKSAGNNVVNGGTLAGLDELLGENEDDTDLGNGEKTFQYHSCYLLRAMREAGTLYEVPGSWRETL
jgi:type II secretory pathway pseudopilin PulG